MHELKQHFISEKCKSYRPLPFWSWNDKLDAEKLKKQARWMAKNGVGGFFMHARSGLKTEYLSEEWMECIEACADEAQKLGVKAWVYDENGWPSGFVGGKLLEKKENCDKYILSTIGSYDATSDVSYLLNEEALIRVKDGEEQGEYLNLFIHTSVCTVDVLNPEVVEQFIQFTHEAYKEHFGDAFSEKIEGFFTDEPEYYRWQTSYTDMIEKAYREEFGKDIWDDLGLLFVEKKGYRRFRYWYWKNMQRLMLDNYTKKVYEWCQQNGVKLTGHYVEEINLGFQIMACGGVMPFYEYEDIPGIDCLWKDMSELASRQVASVAMQLGKKQVLTETFGCCGWDITPTDLKRLAGFQYANGVNMICHHLIPYSERGNRKYDYPAHYSEENPWVAKEFKTFNDYFTNLGYLLGEGTSLVNVAMLHPIRSAYLEYKREEEDFDILHLEKAFADAYRLMSKHGVEYHFLDETLLEKHGFVEENQIGCGKCRYDFLVLPPLLTMDRETEKLIRAYVEQGGRLLMLGDKPMYLEGEPYEYSYLESNCTLEDVIAAQPFRIQNRATEIYSTYRKWEEKEFLYIVNASETNSYTQVYSFERTVKSFEKVDLMNMTSKTVPLTVTLGPGEDALLFLSPYGAEDGVELIAYKFLFSNAEIEFKENALLVDEVFYSTDGINYSEKWPCAALFQKLLEEQYRGPLFLKYVFEVKQVPEEILLRAEANREKNTWLNGQLLTDREKDEKDYINCYDISSILKTGCNEYVAEVDWYEDPFVHYALFGEGVVESLRNCVEYDSELQPIYLHGRFGVYPENGYADDADERFVKGKDFYIGGIPSRVTDITTEGFPFLAGEVVLRQEVEFDNTNILLHVAGDYQAAEVTVNGKLAGKLLFGKELDISKVAVKGKNHIEVRFVIGNRNQMGPHHFAGDKNSIVLPWNFELYKEWNGDKSKLYHEEYDLRRFVRK